MLANIGSRGGPIATPSTIPIYNVKNESLVTKFSKSQKQFVDTFLTKVSAVRKSFFIQIE